MIFKKPHDQLVRIS